MKVYWTKFALESLSEIYQYYKDNVSVIPANKIREGILSRTNQLEQQSLSGPIEECLEDLDQGHRYLIRGNYKIIYKVQKQKVYITDIFDTRQNPERLTKRNN